MSNTTARIAMIVKLRQPCERLNPVAIAHTNGSLGNAENATKRC
ncbi:hypothetical protein [Streptosporangium canum]